MIRHRRPRAWALAASFLAVMVAAGPAVAQSPSSDPDRGPTVSGSVSGSFASGARLTVSVDATMPGGWEGLHLVEVSVRSGARELEHVRFEIEDSKLTVGEQDIVVGTGAVARGAFLEVSGANVIVTTGGGNLSFEFRAGVSETLPEGARLELSVTDDFGTTVKTSRGLAEPEGGGISWGTVAALVAGALFAGAFVGNLFASKRRPASGPSVYGVVQRRLDEERAARGRRSP